MDKGVVAVLVGDEKRGCDFCLLFKYINIYIRYNNDMEHVQYLITCPILIYPIEQHFFIKWVVRNGDCVIEREEYHLNARII